MYDMLCQKLGFLFWWLPCKKEDQVVVVLSHACVWDGSLMRCGDGFMFASRVRLYLFGL